MLFIIRNFTILAIPFILAAMGIDQDQPTETSEGQAAPGSAMNPEQVAACKTASAEYVVATLNDNCDKVNGADESVSKRREVSACQAAGIAFEQAWKAKKCEAAFGARR